MHVFQKNTKLPQFFILLFCCFFYMLNYLMPMIFGDDYVYSFVWPGRAMNIPITETTPRISSWYDLLYSQWSHYFTWNGRITNHILAQLFLWAGKDVFNICNAIVSTLLVMEIYWCIHKGKVSLNLKSAELCWIVFSLWAFTPRYSPVFLWLVGACNYLWTTALLLGFLLPYIRNYYFPFSVTKNKALKYTTMFFVGVFTGCTNENSICWIIFALSLFIYRYRKEHMVENWIYAGLAGLIVGYALLILSPGNLIRLQSNANHVLLYKELFLHRLNNLIEVFLWQFFLWHFCVRSLYKLRSKHKEIINNENLKKDILLIKLFCIIGLGMSAIMLLAPEFPLRSAFPGTVQLIIATGILLRVQKEFSIRTISRHVKVFLTSVGVVYFALSASIVIHHLYEHHIESQRLLTVLDQWKLGSNYKENVFVYNMTYRKRSRLEDFLSGVKTFDNVLPEDDSYWENVAFSRYYGIKGIRMVQNDEQTK